MAKGMVRVPVREQDPKVRATKFLKKFVLDIIKKKLWKKQLAA